ncbi:MFS transporter [Micromonospora sp. DT227]|uniref:MFS transporter n=1 Tax=Micromonospora sp. DT227 TaxID=3393433 RepID=UPI003CF080F8
MVIASLRRQQRLLLLSEAATAFGRNVSQLAIPLIAVLTLHASALQVGLITVAQTLPALCFGPAAGALVDRWNCKRVMVACNVVRVMGLCSIPALYGQGKLTIGTLLAVATFLGTASIFFNPAYRAYLVRVVPRPHLMGANFLVARGAGLAEALGVAVGGSIVQLVGAPFATLATAGTYVFGAVAVLLLPTDTRPGEATAGAPAPAASMLRELREGWQHVRSLPAVRTMYLVEALGAVGFGMSGAVWAIHVTVTLSVPPAVQGVVYGVGGVMTILATMVASRVMSRIRLGHLIWLDHGLGALNLATIALVPAVRPWPVVALSWQRLSTSPLSVLRHVGELTYRQLTVSSGFVARTESIGITVIVAAGSVGQLLGGLVAGVSDTRTTMLVAAAVGMATAVLSVASTPVRVAALPARSPTGGRSDHEKDGERMSV